MTENEVKKYWCSGILPVELLYL